MAIVTFVVLHLYARHCARLWEYQSIDSAFKELSKNCNKYNNACVFKVVQLVPREGVLSSHFSVVNLLVFSLSYGSTTSWGRCENGGLKSATR